MKLVNLEQRSKEWFDFRKQGVGSSDISVIMGSNPFKRTPLSLFNEKTTDLIDYSVSKPMLYGQEQEPKALDYLKSKVTYLAPACAIHDTLDFVRCSFDALGSDTFYEIKCPTSDSVLEKALCGDFPAYWIDQIRWQILVSGFEIGHLAVWDGAMAHIFPIHRDLAWEEQALKAASSFWDNVSKNVMPEAMEDDYIDLEDEEAFQLIQDYKILCEEEKKLSAQKEQLKGRILDMGPGHNFKIGDTKIYQDQRKSYDYNLMQKDGIDIDKYSKLSNPFWVIKQPSTRGNKSAKL